MRIVCKHFGFSAQEINTSLDYGDFFCYLAVALDADELDSFERFRLAGGDAKKWKWATPDHAGTRKVITKKSDVFQTVMGLVNKMGGAQRGSIDEVARARGLPVVYKTADGKIVDSSGNPVDSKGMVFIPSAKHGD